MIHYPKLLQIILNLTEIEALPKCILNKSSLIRNFFPAEIPSLLKSGLPESTAIISSNCTTNELYLSPESHTNSNYIKKQSRR